MDNQSVISKDSYTERRKLFKDIWDTAVKMDDKEPECGPKPKVIKTLRLGEKDGINIGKSKKQRIKNLRTVCTRLLDFCDRQDAADLMYDQMSAACENSNNTSVVFTRQPKHKKKLKKKKKEQQTYSYVRQRERCQDKTKTSFDLEVPDGSVTHRGTRPVRDIQSPRIKRATLIQQFLNERYNLAKAPTAPAAPSAPEQNLQVGDAPCKVVKKKYRKRKKVAPIPSQLPRATSAHMKRVHTRTSKRKKSP